MKKITIVLFLSIFFSAAANAGTDGENLLSKNKPESVKDCFETVNRGIFAFNQFLDGVIFEPVARGLDIFLLQLEQVLVMLWVTYQI